MTKTAQMTTLVLSAALFAGACSDSPTAPGKLKVVADANASPEKIANYDKMQPISKQGMESPGSWFDDDQVGHGKKTNLTGVSNHYQLLLLDRTNPDNQVLLEWTREPQIIARDDSNDFTVGLQLDRCDNRPIQVDFVRNVPFYITKGTTWSELHNFLDGGDSRIRNQRGGVWTPGSLPGCGDDPSSPPTIVPPPNNPPKLTPPVNPICTGGGTFFFPVRSYIAKFPADFIGAWYPESVSLSLFIPNGTWRIKMETGDEHALKNDGTQGHEQGIPAFPGGPTLGPTNDVPDDADSIVTDYGNVTFAANVMMMNFGEFGPRPLLAAEGGEPTDSFYPILVTYSCPVDVVQQLVRR